MVQSIAQTRAEETESAVPERQTPRRAKRRPTFGPLPEWAVELESLYARPIPFHMRHCPIPLPTCPACRAEIEPKTGSRVILRPDMHELGRYGAKLTNDQIGTFKNRGLVKVRFYNDTGEVWGWCLHDPADTSAPFCGWQCESEYAAAALRAGFTMPDDGDFQVGPRADWKLSSAQTNAAICQMVNDGDFAMAAIDVGNHKGAVIVFDPKKKAATERARLIVECVGGKRF